MGYDVLDCYNSLTDGFAVLVMTVVGCNC